MFANKAPIRHVLFTQNISNLFTGKSTITRVTFPANHTRKQPAWYFISQFFVLKNYLSLVRKKFSLAKFIKKDTFFRQLENDGKFWLRSSLRTNIFVLPFSSFSPFPSAFLFYFPHCLPLSCFLPLPLVPISHSYLSVSLWFPITFLPCLCFFLSTFFSLSPSQNFLCLL
uniref:Uncharacterized protein n=1 Tax=Cacopsylla melanoneura TaxID=428564 RepID=A0A8D8YC41_9HEMI